MLVIQPNEFTMSCCHRCGGRLAPKEGISCEVAHFYGQTSPHEALKAVVVLPVCDECTRRKKKTGIAVGVVMAIIAIIPVVTTLKQALSLFDLWPLPVIVLWVALGAFFIAYFLLEFSCGYQAEFEGTHTEIIEKYKWKYGIFDPNDDENKSKGCPEIVDTQEDMLAELEAAGYRWETVEDDDNPKFRWENGSFVLTVDETVTD